MLRCPTGVVLFYACLLKVGYGQAVSSQPACFPHVSSISYPAKEWGAEVPIRATVHFEVRSDGHFENVQVSGDNSDEIANTITDLLSKNLAPSDCSGKHGFVQLNFRMEGKPTTELNSAVSIDDSGVIQFANPPEAICKAPLNCI
jgi:hypothetical protein